MKIFNKATEKKKPEGFRSPTPPERIFRGEKVSKEEMELHVSALREKEEKRKAEEKRTEEECLARLGYTGANLEEMRRDGYRRNLKNGKYAHDPSQPPGSIDNPREVGMEGCCTTLFFVPSLGGWVLTDGLGNGVLR